MTRREEHLSSGSRRGRQLTTGDSLHQVSAIRALIELAVDRGAVTAVVGHGRDATSTEIANAFSDAWSTGSREVLEVVSWPEAAASWLRQANRFAVQVPDIWVMTGEPPGISGMMRRLASSPRWSPARTMLIADELPEGAENLLDAGELDGLVGITATGRTWEIFDRRCEKPS